MREALLGFLPEAVRYHLTVTPKEEQAARKDYAAVLSGLCASLPELVQSRCSLVHLTPQQLDVIYTFRRIAKTGYLKNPRFRISRSVSYETGPYILHQLRVLVKEEQTTTKAKVYGCAGIRLLKKQAFIIGLDNARSLVLCIVQPVFPSSDNPSLTGQTAEAERLVYQGGQTLRDDERVYQYVGAFPHPDTQIDQHVWVHSPKVLPPQGNAPHSLTGLALNPSSI